MSDDSTGLLDDLRQTHELMNSTDAYTFCVECRDFWLAVDVPEECEESHTTITENNYHRGITEWVNCLEYLS